VPCTCLLCLPCCPARLRVLRLVLRVHGGWWLLLRCCAAVPVTFCGHSGGCHLRTAAGRDHFHLLQSFYACHYHHHHHTHLLLLPFFCHAFVLPALRTAPPRTCAHLRHTAAHLLRIWFYCRVYRVPVALLRCVLLLFAPFSPALRCRACIRFARCALPGGSTTVATSWFWFGLCR